MKAKKILVPIDFSVSSDAALGLAVTMAQDTGATLLLLHVEETPELFVSGEYLDVSPAALKAEARKRLSELILPDANLPCQRYLLTGNPWVEIVRLAKEQEVDYIVMGTHGRRGVSRMLLGSIAEAVLRRAPCPVITVKHPVITEQPVVEEPAATV